MLSALSNKVAKFNGGRKMNVAVLGASNKPDRYSYKAIKLLQECGHHVFPVHPKLQETLKVRL